ncbi:MAG: nascent polypeptide-associated complex protein [Candidatus Helarchaeota archaeon]
MSKWHKIKKQQARKTSSRSMKRAMKKIQQDPNLNIKEIPNVIEIIIKTSDKVIKIENPENVSTMQIPGQGRIYQILGGIQGEVEGDIELQDTLKEELPIENDIKPIEIPLEDVQLVAQQTGVSEDEARNALIKNKGDLAKAIIELKK